MHDPLDILAFRDPIRYKDEIKNLKYNRIAN